MVKALQKTAKATHATAVRGAHAAGLRSYLDRRRNNSAANAFMLLLGMPPAETSSVARQLEQGLHYVSFEHLRNAIGLSPAEASDLLDIPARTIARRRQEGRLQPHESERVVRFARLLASVVDLFEGDDIEARRWLRTPQRALGGETPLRMARTEIGAREVESLIGRLEQGVFS